MSMSAATETELHREAEGAAVVGVAQEPHCPPALWTGAPTTGPRAEPLAADGGSREESFKVVEIREKLIGGKLSGEKLAKVLNENAAKAGS